MGIESDAVVIADGNVAHPVQPANQLTKTSKNGKCGDRSGIFVFVLSYYFKNKFRVGGQ